MPLRSAYTILLLDRVEKDCLKQLLSLPVHELEAKLLNEKNTRSKWIIEQAVRRKKIQHKLPLIYENLDLVLPPTLHLEQCSSEATAAFKSSLFYGDRFIDFTAGMGVDALYLAKCYKHGTILELNQELCKLVVHNLSVLNVSNVTVLDTPCEQFLQSYDNNFDLGYIDPARRDAHGGRVKRLEDYTPNILTLQHDMLLTCKRVMLKASPLLDIKKSIQDLKHVSDVYVISVENECKELLFILNQTDISHTAIHAICIGTTITKFSFTFEEEQQAKVQYALPQNYLYEPDAAVLKAGAFKQLAYKYGLRKLHRHTHLYTSDVLVEGFPGRIFTIEHVCKPDRKDLIKYIPDLTMNLTIRNYPMTVDTLKKRLSIRDGGEWYVFGCTLQDNTKGLILCKKINP